TIIPILEPADLHRPKGLECTRVQGAGSTAYRCAPRTGQREEPLTAALVERPIEEVLMDPLTPLDTLCRIILRAREYEAQTATDYEGNETADNVDDEEEGTLSVLDDTINDSIEEELRAVFEDLGEDQLAEVIAFCWVGQ